ncbi:hypothetical protein QL285_014276 [Trifolium repens]|nr:hypothetical protein QL285_014276 [Trifolium repens]
MTTYIQQKHDQEINRYDCNEKPQSTSPTTYSTSPRNNHPKCWLHKAVKKGTPNTVSYRHCQHLLTLHNLYSSGNNTTFTPTSSSTISIVNHKK